MRLLIKTNLPSLIIALFIFFSCNTQEKESETEKVKFETTGSIERLSPKLDNIIKPDAEIEILASGFKWSEGPQWISEINSLIFSDIPQNKIFKWNEEEGLSDYLYPAGYTGDVSREGESGSNGLLLNSDRKLILCQHGDRRVAIMNASLEDPKPNFETLAGEYDGKKLNSPNDAIFDSQGNLFFTDPPYGLEERMEDPLKELSFQGVYVLKKNGEISLLTDSITRPNGIGIMPDGKTLIVANSDGKKPYWYAFTITDSLTLTDARIFMDATKLSKEMKGGPDGLKIDSQGNIFATGPGGVWVISPEGEHLGIIKTGQATANCSFSADSKTLYMTAHMHLMRVKLKD